MKRFYILLIIMTAGITGWSQTTWTGNAGNGSWTTNGNWTNNAPTTSNQAVFSNGGSFTVTNVPATIGAISVTGNTTVTLTRNGTGTTTISNLTGTTDLNIAAGSTLNMGANMSLALSNSATATIAGTLTIPTNRTYSTNANANNLTTVSGTIVNAGSISSTTARLTFASGGVYNHNQNGGDLPTATYDANSTVVFDRGGTTNISIPGSVTIGKISVSNNTSTAVSSDNGTQTLTISNGTGDDLSVESGSTFTQNSSMENLVLATSSTANIAGTYNVNGSTFSLSNNSVVATVTGRLINSGNITGASAAKLIFNAGTYEHDQDGSTVPTAAWNTGSTVHISGMSSNYPAGMGQTFVNVLFTSNVSMFFNDMTSSLTCTGDLTLSNTGNPFRLVDGNTSRTITVGGNMSVTSGTFTTSNGSGTGTITVSGNFNLSGGATTFNLKANSGAATLNVGGNFNQSNGDFLQRRISNNATASVVNVTGAFNLSGGTYDLAEVAGTSNLNIAGGYNQTGGTIERSSSGTATVNFTGTTEQNFTKTAGTISSVVNFNINTNAKVNFGTSVLNGTNATFTLTNGGRIITSNTNGLSTNGSIQVGGTRAYSNAADYEFRGPTTGVFTTTSNNVRSLIINNTGGQVTMARAFNVNGTLAMENGYLTPGANVLTVTTSGTATTANGSFVNGSMVKQTNSTAAFTFPVGKVSGGLRTIGITPTSTAASNFTAEFLRTNGQAAITNGTAKDATLKQVSTCEYWTLNRTGSASAAVTLSWNANSNCGGAYVTELMSLRVARHNGTAWQNEGPATGAALPSTVGAGTITSNAVSSFSPFALASSAASENPLPVLFANVKAYAKNTGVQVEWSNLTERDILKYEVERSVNGVDFTAINEQAPKSNRDDKASYTYFDATPVNGANFYRVRVEEVGGKLIYSKVLRVELGTVKNGFSVYPNPVTGKQLTVTLSGIRSGQYSLRVINTAGQDVYKTNITNVGAGVTQMIELPASVKTGVYTTLVTGDGYQQSQIIIVQ